MGIRRAMTVTASTVRSPLVVGGKRGTPVTEIASLRCTPLDPADPDLIERASLKTPLELLQSFTIGDYDIKEGDLLVVGSVQYPIRACGDWECSDGKLFYMLLEQLKVQ